MLYSKNNQYPKSIPFRIVLSDGKTRTDASTFTDEEIADAGYIAVENPPTLIENQSLSWDGNNWVVSTKTEQEILDDLEYQKTKKWQYIRETRDLEMENFEWRYTRYHREVRLGLTPTDDIVMLDTYMQALADITQQEDPFNIVWPVYGSEEDPEEDI